MDEELEAQKAQRIMVVIYIVPTALAAIWYFYFKSSSPPEFPAWLTAIIILVVGELIADMIGNFLWGRNLDKTLRKLNETLDRLAISNAEMAQSMNKLVDELRAERKGVKDDN
jgi:hypothetical protein